MDVTVQQIDGHVRLFIDENMCTETCPCYRGVTDENYAQYVSLGEEEVNNYLVILKLVFLMVIINLNMN